MNGISASNYSSLNGAIRTDGNGQTFIWKATEGKMLRHLGCAPDGKPLFSNVPVEEVDVLLRAENWNPIERMGPMRSWFNRVVYGISRILHIPEFRKGK